MPPALLRFLWQAGITAAFFCGILVGVILSPQGDSVRTPATVLPVEAHYSDDVRPPSRLDVIIEVDGPDVAFDAGEENSEREANEEEEYDDLPQPAYKYKFPFDDGRRMGVPAGSLMDNYRAIYQEISGEILARWGDEYTDTLFSGGMTFSDGGKLVEDKMLNALVEQGGFVVAFTGNSVTAGHDCLFEQSYPIVLNATMARLFSVTGVRFEAINVAMGNTRAAPYSFCLDAHAGIHADIISWEMAMEVVDRVCGPAAEVIELFVRSASVLPRRPAVLVMNAQPDHKYCGKNRLTSMQNRGFVGNCKDAPPENNLMSAYAAFGLHTMFINELVTMNTCEDERFSHNSLYGIGKHYPKPMSWHPGPRAHQLVADLLFMHYAHVFLSALERLETVSPGATAQQLRDETEAGKATLLAAAGVNNSQEVSGDGSEFMGTGRGTMLPDPKWCKGWLFCENAGNYRCSNTYYPLGGTEGSRLLDMVSERTPVLNADLNEVTVEPAEDHWAVTLNEEKKVFFNYLKVPDPEGMHKPIDMKWVLVGNRISGPIEFEFETKGVVGKNSTEGGDGARAMENSRVVVCKPDFIDRVELTDTDGVRYKIDGEETSVFKKLGQRYLKSNSCVILAAQIGMGRHTLSIESLSTGRHLVCISHVIYPA